MAANSSTTSKSTPGVSYLQIYKSWLKNDHDRNRDYTIPVEVILDKLMFLLTNEEYQIVDNERTKVKKLKKLFIDILPSKDEQGFEQLVNKLFENKCGRLANDLLMEKKKLSGSDHSNEPLGDVKPKKEIYQTSSFQNPQMKGAQAHLSHLIEKKVDFMAKYWADVIPVAKTEAAFIQVQVLEHFKSEDGKPVSSYQEVFDKDGKTIHERILIQADPGCGKTTYVNKLALDWANKDEYLREKFDFIFLISLQTLTMDVFDAIKWFLPDESEQFFASYAKSRDSKILLILDGFDELVDSSEWYSSVMHILEGKSKQFQFYHVIVTTRRSHVEKIPQQFRERSLLIKGFDEESMKQFLIKQNVSLPSVGQQSNLNRLLQTPLFCAIYCSLHFGGGDPIELEDSYDLIKALVENSVTNTRKKKTVANVEEQLNEIGKFAFQMLDNESLKVKRFCSSSEVIKPSFDLSGVNLDLLIKRTIPTQGVGGFKEEFTLPHQLIAEYLAARYFAGSLTEEQLKQANALFIPFYLNLPFVQFFIFELLFLYLEKKYEETVFDNFLNIPKLRFIWNIKSNTDIPTLDNVSDLYLDFENSELVHHSRLIPTLSKCQNLFSLYLSGLSKNQVEQLVNFINNNCFQQKLIELDLSWNANVGSTPQLFTALSKCKHLQRLKLKWCKMTVESATELARCIDNNGLSNLRQLVLSGNENVGSSTHLFHILHKCRQLQMLDLDRCSMTQESLNIFLSTFNSNTFQQFNNISLRGNEESMKQLLIKQNVSLPSVHQQSILNRLPQTPLFCAIYCSLHFGGGDPTELEDSYDLIKAFVENSVINTLQKKTVANDEEQLDEIGKFAFQMLDSASLDFLKMFCRSEAVIKPSFTLSTVNLDLLIKRTIPLGGVNRFKEEFSFPHQLVAEYLAARYFARSLTEEQLNQADTSAFTYPVLDLPFVHFFLFELLFLYLEKKYEESVFDNFLNKRQIRFFWNYKSNADIPTLDNVSDLGFRNWNSELKNHSRFIPTLSKWRNMSSLHLSGCGLSKNQMEQLVNFINNNCFQKLIKLNLGLNENVGSTPQLFTVLSKCKHLQVLDVAKCEMTVESTTELARCFDNNGLANLKELYLNRNENVGSSIHLFHVLHKCPQLQKLHLQDCSMTQESLNIFLSTFDSSTFQQLVCIWLTGNRDIKVYDNFFITLEKCLKISHIFLSYDMKSDLSEVGRKAKETLKQQGCQFRFD